MKVFIAFALLIVSISALPHQLTAGIDLKNERLVSDSIASVIEEASQMIKDAGLDPLYIRNEEGRYALPVPVILTTQGWIEEFLLRGLSDIVINNVSFSILTYRVRLDITMPLIEATLGRAESTVIFFGEEYKSSASGRLAIKDININADIRASVGIISGISIRSIDMNFKLGAIESDLAVTVANNDITNNLNTFLGTTITDTLSAYENEINQLIEIVTLDIINANL